MVLRAAQYRFVSVPPPPHLAEARTWYDQTYLPWVTGSIGGVTPAGGADTLLGPGRSPDPVTAKEVASAGLLTWLDPSQWIAPWDLLEHLDDLWDNCVGMGCGCLVVLLLLPCLLPWALLVLLAVAFGARPLQRPRSAAASVASGPAVPDPIPGWLAELGLINPATPLPPWWSAVCQDAGRHGVQPASWQPVLAHHMIDAESGAEWYQTMLRREEGNGVVQLWSLCVWPAATEQALESPERLQRLLLKMAFLPDGVAYGVLPHAPLRIPLSAAPVSWPELEEYLRLRAEIAGTFRRLLQDAG